MSEHPRPKVFKAPKPKKQSVIDRLTDPTNYTGTARQARNKDTAQRPVDLAQIVRPAHKKGRGLHTGKPASASTRAPFGSQRPMAARRQVRHRRPPSQHFSDEDRDSEDSGEEDQPSQQPDFLTGTGSDGPPPPPTEQNLLEEPSDESRAPAPSLSSVIPPPPPTRTTATSLVPPPPGMPDPGPVEAEEFDWSEEEEPPKPPKRPSPHHATAVPAEPSSPFAQPTAPIAAFSDDNFGPPLAPAAVSALGTPAPNIPRRPWQPPTPKTSQGAKKQHAQSAIDSATFTASPLAPAYSAPSPTGQPARGLGRPRPPVRPKPPHMMGQAPSKPPPLPSGPKPPSRGSTMRSTSPGPTGGAPKPQRRGTEIGPGDVMWGPEPLPAGGADFLELIHQFPLVSRQVETGLYNVKRVAALLKKLCTLEEKFTNESSRAISHEADKKGDRSGGDGMKLALTAWMEVQDVLRTHYDEHSNFRSQVMLTVVAPLQEFFTAAELKRKDILHTMKGHRQRVKAATSQLQKSKKNALSCLQNLKEAQDRSRGVVPPKPTTKLGFLKGKLKSLAAEPMDVVKDKAMAACAQYQETLDHTNKVTESFQRVELPTVFAELYALESTRLRITRDAFQQLSTLYKNMLAPLQTLSSRLQSTAGGMDTAQDLATFVENWVSVYGEPPKQTQKFYDLPCSATDLRMNRWNGSMELKTNHKSIFGVTLERVMELQRETHPEAKVPMIAQCLIEAIQSTGGADAEGIFRISTNKTELDKLHRQFDEGKYSVPGQSPHLPAALLKEWLRELSEPLVPMALYSQAVEAVQADDPVLNQREVLKVYQQLPALNKALIERLAQLFTVIMANSDVNKMTCNNLAIVFAPSFLRGDSDDPFEMMMNAKFETKFTAAIIAALTR